MPQIRIDYSANVAGAFQARVFARHLHERLVEIIETQIASCKTRLVRLEDFLVGDGDESHAMIHVDVRILPGRTAEDKQRLGAAILDGLEQHVQKSQRLRLQLTAEVRDLAGDDYHKRLL